MPIFEFVCSACENEFEALILGSRTDVKCPKCGSTEARKKMSAFAFKAGPKFVGTGKKASAPACAGCSSTSCSTCGE